VNRSLAPGPAGPSFWITAKRASDLIAGQIDTTPRQKCACVGQHGGSGRYVFLGPDGGHYRRSNYARRVFRLACDGRHESDRQVIGARQAYLVHVHSIVTSCL
jgi:hypothetical protein